MIDAARSLRVGDLVVDFGHRKVLRNETDIELPDLSWRLLEHLITIAPRAAPIGELLETVWGDVNVSNETVTQRVALLRKAIGDSCKPYKYVRTVRGVGYAWALQPESMEILDRSSNPAGPALGAPSGVRTAPAGLAVAAMGIIAILGASALALLGPINLSAIPEASAPVSSAVTTEELVRHADDYLRRANENANERAIGLYKEALSRDPQNAIALTGLSLAYGHRVSKYNYSHDWAYRAMGHARHALNLNGRNARAHVALGLAYDSLGDVEQALKVYKEAVSIDPNYAGALLSASYLMQVKGDLAQSLLWNLRAAKRDSGLLFLETQIGILLHLLEFDEQAERWFKRAMVLKPDNYAAHVSYAKALIARGKDAEAKAILLKIAGKNHNNAQIPLLLGQLALSGNKTEEAMGRFEQAYRIARDKAVGRSYELAVRLRTMGFNDESSKQYKDFLFRKDALMKSGDKWPDSNVDAAYVYLAAQEKSLALESLRTAAKLGYRDWRFLIRHPLLKELRSEPEFKEIISEMRALVRLERDRLANSGKPAMIQLSL